MLAVTATLPTTAGVSQPTATGSGTPVYWGSVSGQRIAQGTVSMPLYGAWVADVTLATDTVLPTSVTVAIGNMALEGKVYRQTAFAGRLEARIVAGAGGWSQIVEARGYSNPAGVLASQVLTDAALDVGETIVVTNDTTLGNFYERLNDKASRVLRAIVGEQWWIDPAGITHAGTRPATPITTDFQVISFAGAVGRATIATEDPASWMPGATFSSPTISQQTIASIRHVFTDNGIARLEVMTSATNDRWIEDIRQMIRDELAASIAYARIWEYQVVATDGQTVAAFPVDPSAPVPPVTGLTIPAGLGALPAEGSKVAIAFLDANPAKPVLLPNEGLLASFVQQFLTWTPSGVVGDAVALKTLITAWQLANGVVPSL